MAHQSLYRRYRPRRFADVKGQDHVSTTLANAVREDRVGHAYLFSGPRGTGKTSTARILAMALNCLAPTAGEPCGVCNSCMEITEGRSLDVLELDAASNRGIDAMRDLVGRVALATPGNWKVYIVDEVHMLTTEASNTLLKTLEEPPEHVVFVLATTEPQKVLPTVRSRAQHFEFRLLGFDLLAEHLRWVVGDAGLDVAPDAMDVVARRAAGSVRDALSMLDQAVAAGGVDDASPLPVDIVEAISERDLGAALVAVAERCAAGHDPRQLTRDLLGHLRQVFLATMAPDLVALPADDLAAALDQARRLGPAAVVRSMELLGEMLVAMRDAPEPRILLETALARLCRPETDASPAALLERIERLERSIAGGAASVAPVAAAAATAPAVASPPPDAASSPVSGARRALGAFRSTGAPSTTVPATTVPAAESAESPAEKVFLHTREESGSEPAASAAAATPASAGASAAAGAFPTRDELTMAWGDRILGQLAQRPRARFRVGRFVSVEDQTALFALPNRLHRDRCEECRAEVESALSAHFGRRVPVRLVVDETDPSARGGGPAGAAAGEGPPEDEESVDMNDLTDAPAAELASPMDHVMQAFQGAQVVEE